MKRTLPIFAITVFAFAAMTGAAWAQNPIIGTWKTNPAKSTIPLGPPSTVSNLNKFEPSGANGFKHTSDRTNAQGEITRFEYTANFDGKTYPYKGPGPGRDGVSVKKVDPYTYQIFYKKGGETVQINYYIVARDGKTLTSISTGLTNTGQVYNRMMVYDKQ